MKMAFNEGVFSEALTHTQSQHKYVFSKLARKVIEELINIKNSEHGDTMSIQEIRRRVIQAVSMTNSEHHQGYNQLMIKYMSLAKQAKV